MPEVSEWREIKISVFAMQAAFVLFWKDDHTMKLPYFIAIAGFVCALFAIGIPNLSALGVWLGVSTVLSTIYIVIAIWLSVRDGRCQIIIISASL